MAQYHFIKLLGAGQLSHAVQNCTGFFCDASHVLIENQSHLNQFCVQTIFFFILYDIAISISQQEKINKKLRYTDKQRTDLDLK